MGSIDVVSNNVLQLGLDAYQAGSESLHRSATVAADLSTRNNGKGMSSSLLFASVDILSASLQTKAAGKIIESAVRHEGTLGSIIDTYA